MARLKIAIAALLILALAAGAGGGACAVLAGNPLAWLEFPISSTGRVLTDAAPAPPAAPAPNPLSSRAPPVFAA